MPAIMSEYGRFSRYNNTSQVKSILTYHIQMNKSRNDLPMCIKKGKHDRATAQRTMYQAIMSSPAFSCIPETDQPSLDTFVEKVRSFTDLAKKLFKVPRPQLPGNPTGSTNSVNQILSGFNVVRSEQSLDREAGLLYLESHIVLGIQNAVWKSEWAVLGIVEQAEILTCLSVRIIDENLSASS